ncbi:MAG: hypothetical protein L0G27_05470 [Paracoccus sp. (in: a-proteobacteria)]|nr:hypothetical protein [Paracoccus sp. (in: a-proteobacteria)]
MSDLKLVIDAHMRALVARIGCFDAVAETINARWGAHTAKGTISRKASGSLDWTLLDAIALEDALGSHPITRLMERRRATAAACDQNISPIAAAAIISKEAGEAVCSILAAEQSDNAGDRATAIIEIDDAIAALTAAGELLRASIPSPEHEGHDDDRKS